MGSRSKYVSVIWQFIQVAYDFSKHVVPYTCYCLLAGKPSTAKQVEQAAWLRNTPLVYLSALSQTWRLTSPINVHPAVVMTSLPARSASKSWQYKLSLCAAWLIAAPVCIISIIVEFIGKERKVQRFNVVVVVVVVVVEFFNKTLSNAKQTMKMQAEKLIKSAQSITRIKQKEDKRKTKHKKRWAN